MNPAVYLIDHDPPGYLLDTPEKVTWANAVDARLRDPGHASTPRYGLGDLSCFRPPLRTKL